MDYVITVGANSKGKGGIPYRAVPAAHAPEDPEKGKVWFFQYQVLPDPEWRPRGTFYEKDGKFIWGGKEYPSPYEALAARVHQGI